MKKQWLIAAAVLAVGAGGSAALIMSGGEPETREPGPQIPIVQTVAAEVRTEPLLVLASGTVRPVREVQLAAQVSGRAVYVHPRLVSGGRIGAGELLVRIDPADFQARVVQARAAVQEAQVQLRRTREEARLARQEYARFQARERLRASGPAGIDPDDYASGFVPPPGIETGGGGTAGTTRPGALLFQGPQLEAAQAALDRSRAQLQEAELALSRTRVVAPFSAVVRSETVDRGSLVQQGQELARLYGSDALEVVAPIAATSAALLPALGRGPGGGRTSAQVRVDYGALTYGWPGQVDRVEGTVDEQSRTLNVVIRVPRPISGGRPVGPPSNEQQGPDVPTGPPPPLLPGQYARVAMQGVSPGSYFAVPRAGLRRDNQLWLAVDGRLRKVSVRLLQAQDEAAFVQGPLPSGARIIVGDVNGAAEGMRIRLAGERQPTQQQQQQQQQQQKQGQRQAPGNGSGS